MKKQVYHILTLLYFTVVIFAAERQSISFFWIASNRLHIAMPFLFSVLFVFVLHAVFIAKKAGAIRLLFCLYCIIGAACCFI